MFKAVGIILILVSLGSFVLDKVENKKAIFLNFCQIKKALNFLKHELSFSTPEISKLCSKTSSHIEGEISDIFKELSDNLKHNADFFTAWQTATKNKSLFSDNVNNIILDFVKAFGKKTLDIEIENIEKTLLALEMIETEEREKYIQDRKLIYTLGTAVGAVIIILVI